MAKRSDFPGNRDRVETDKGEVVEFPLHVEFDLPKPVVRQLILLKDLTLNVIGPVTGEHYVFHGAGSTVDVDIRDIPGLLEKHTKTSCCGANGPTPYFSVVGG